MTVQNQTVQDRITSLLKSAQIPYTRIEHPPTYTAEQAAQARGLSAELGGKSLVLRVYTEPRYRVFVVSGARRIDNRALRHALGIDRVRFASRDELKTLTGLAPGCVPPFGRPIFDMPLYVDQHTADNVRIAFSPGAHDVSFVMRVSDYLQVADPDRIFPFSQPRADRPPSG